MREVMERAFAAWFRGSRTGLTPAYPSQTMSDERTLPDGRHYVVLANSYQILGVYRVKPDGFLRRLRRWPKALEEGFPT